jgi:hypothetical protein
MEELQLGPNGCVHACLCAIMPLQLPQYPHHQHCRAHFVWFGLHCFLRSLWEQACGCMGAKLSPPLCPALSLPLRGLLYCMEYLEDNLDDWLTQVCTCACGWARHAPLHAIVHALRLQSTASEAASSTMNPMPTGHVQITYTQGRAQIHTESAPPPHPTTTTRSSNPLMMTITSSLTARVK